MAGKFHYTISANYCNVEADDMETLNSKMRDLVNDEEFPVLLEQFTVVTKVGPPTLAQAVSTVKAQIPGTTEVKPERPAPPAPVPQPTSGEMRIEANKFGDKFFIYDHPQAILTPDGKKAILLWAKGKSGKPYAKWIGEDIASGAVKMMDGWGVLCTYDIDKTGLPAFS